MNYRLEVKVTGHPSWRRKPTYEVIWLDWDFFQVIPTSKRANNVRALVSNGQQAFDILRGKARENHLIAAGYDPKAVYTPE